MKLKYREGKGDRGAFYGSRTISAFSIDGLRCLTTEYDDGKGYPYSPLTTHVSTCNVTGTMSPKDAANFRIDTFLLAAMRRVKDEKGVPVTTQIEMAVRAWLKSEYGIVVKADRKHAVTRKRP